MELYTKTYKLQSTVPGTLEALVSDGRFCYSSPCKREYSTFKQKYIIGL